MQQVNSGIAYLVWCLCLFGVCGGQRFYTGNFASGVIYLVTFGLFGFGQLIDLALIPGMVERRNLYLRGLYGGGNSNNANQQSVTVNIGEIPQMKELQELQKIQAPTSSKTSPMQKLLKAAKEHGGQLSIAQAAMYTEFEPEEIKTLLEEAQRLGYAEMTNDLNTGAIRYKFDI